ncbi:hypothetical protein I4U23_013393 [Adineta vaga]|nr:hypothetical protein I4U23_013393 [Adineta vaga]
MYFTLSYTDDLMFVGFIQDSYKPDGGTNGHLPSTDSYGNWLLPNASPIESSQLFVVFYKYTAFNLRQLFPDYLKILEQIPNNLCANEEYISILQVQLMLNH